jgi:hypothetical protein
MTLVDQELPLPFPQPRLIDSRPVYASARIDGPYRFTLSRVWDKTRGQLCWVMLNPSTADATKDDPTITRCINFAVSWGFGAITVVNLFALRATDPRQLSVVEDAIGPANESYVLGAMHQSLMTVAAWGASIPRRHAEHVARMRAALLAYEQSAVHVLGLTKHGQPRHPLFVPAMTRSVPWYLLTEGS